jgi:hypothetical protein
MRNCCLSECVVPYRLLQVNSRLLPGSSALGSYTRRPFAAAVGAARELGEDLAERQAQARQHGAAVERLRLAEAA